MIATLTHSPDRDCASPMGIPVDNMTMSETVRSIMTLAHRRDGRSRLVSTLNVDFIVNALGGDKHDIRHPELLKVLRDSEIVTADGFPVLWLSKIAGYPLKQRVCGSDLLPELARSCANEGLSFYFLGGANGVAKRAADILIEQYPGLQVAGVAEPFIHVDGPESEKSEETDAELVDSINRSGASILFIGLGNPKQELWFNRNQHRLTVPVAIGVGGTFEFIAGTVRRAPTWVQRSNLEWVYRITQDPARLWRRYASGILTMARLGMPLIKSRIKESVMFFGRNIPDNANPHWRDIWSSKDSAISLIRLPELVGRDYLKSVVDCILRKQPDKIRHIIDFSNVKKIRLAAYPFLFSLGELQHRYNDQIKVVGVSDQLQADLQIARVVDSFAKSDNGIVENLRKHKNKDPEALAVESYSLSDMTIVMLSGPLNLTGLQASGLIASLEEILNKKACVLDFRQVTSMDSLPGSLLMRIRRQVGKDRLMFSGATHHVFKMLCLSAKDRSFELLADPVLGQMMGGK